MKKLRMGIIGMGMAFERLHYPAYQRLKDQYEITAICDTDKEKANNWRATLGLSENDVYEDYQEMIKRSDLDAFDVMVPIELNYEVTEHVAAAGKPIICEKPLAPTPEQAKAARDLPSKYDIPIMIAENYRYNDEIQIIRDMVRKQEIGEVYYFIQNRVVDFPKDMLKNKFPAKEWRQHPEFPGGAIMDTGVHDIGALRHIFGAIKKLHAFGKRQEEEFAPFAVIQANMLFKSGITSSFTFFSAGKEMQRPLMGLRIFGTEGEIFLEERDCGTINVAMNDGSSRQIPYRPQQGYYHELQNFYQAAIGREPLSVTPELEFGDAITILAMLQSAKTGEVISVDQSQDFDFEAFRQQNIHTEQPRLQ
ncbi:Gfo/Idh/MocA family oxidoreductase [Metallumcola ferriviriculae]|uniref:Gfo/Idh/MocA family oxidoreductase n=1 Tax=Metallumcola ferriviriculae TaxID=3039180 RepID=A0AAU0UG74_9FIRM|nr:Gfo/Idh/MocA family oxidoreductase [Desulfitibacteraceae bacterium MK1]